MSAGGCSVIADHDYGIPPFGRDRTSCVLRRELKGARSWSNPAGLLRPPASTRHKKGADVSQGAVFGAEGGGIMRAIPGPHPVAPIGHKGHRRFATMFGNVPDVARRTQRFRDEGALESGEALQGLALRELARWPAFSHVGGGNVP